MDKELQAAIEEFEKAQSRPYWVMVASAAYTFIQERDNPNIPDLADALQGLFASQVKEG